MCGYVGYINLKGKPIHFDTLKRMTDAQVHRGPDDQGFVGLSNNHILPIVSESCIGNSMFAGVGFNRLSIQDLSDNGHQPMLSSCGRYVVAYNGEIYNAVSLRDDLKKRGLQFRGYSDTEVILNLYIEYGLDKALSLLNGMFSFFVYDLRNNQIFIVRDHFGIKPLYYYSRKDSLLFSSEIKSFHYHPDYEARLDEDNLEEYMLFRSCAHDRTLISGVKQVPPGCYVSVKGGDVRLHRYWDIDNSYTEQDICVDDVENQLHHLLKDVIKSQLVSDVKVGCQLSGGIDSSLVTSYARKQFNANMDTFSIVFSDKTYSEESWVSYVASMTQSDSHRFYLTDDYVIDNFYKATWHLDQPISIPNAIGIMRLAEGASNTVKVLLSGEGADEVFGGYSRYHDLSMRGIFAPIKPLVLASKRLDRKYRFSIPEKDFFILASSALTEWDFRLLRGETGYENALSLRRNLYPNGQDSIKNACIYDMKTHMVDLLNRQDKMTMANSVENRVPFLDRRVVQYAMSHPGRSLVSRIRNPMYFRSPEKHTKKPLKDLAMQRFGRDFVYRKKSGFPIPEDRVFSNARMIQLIEDLVMPGIAQRDLFNYNTVKTMWNNKNRSRSETKNLWMALSFEVWAQQFLKR